VAAQEARAPRHEPSSIEKRPVHHGIHLLILLFAAAAANAQDLSECVRIDEAEARLRCYDRISGRAQLTPAPEAPAEPPFRERWEQHLETEAALEPFAIRAYEPNYALVTYLQSFNYAPYRPFDPNDQLSPTEIKLNISLQSKLLDDIFGNNGDLWISYTQTSYWQLFNADLSSPFRETDYNPELRLAFLTEYTLAGLTLRDVSFGLRHDSNGQAGSLSRSWNRVFADFQVAHGGLVLSFRPSLAVFGASENPDIERYYGHLDVRALWETRQQLFALTLRNPFKGRSGAELNWSFPISGRLRGFAQWYYGYGENLIDYNHKNNRLGLGLLLSDWL
jgi:phospholipase A1/A2